MFFELPPPSKTFIIAEAGVNHNGSIEMALKLVEVAALAGADAVKFQTFQSEQLVSRSAKKADYQLETTDQEESQLEMLKKLELKKEDHFVLAKRAKELGILFLSSPFDLESLDFLIGTLDLPLLKIPSGEITNAPLLLKAAQSGKKMILSTGMSTIGEIEFALSVLAFGMTQTGKPSRAAFHSAFTNPESYQKLKERVSLLQCTTSYPTAASDVNLRVISTLEQAFGLRVGLSDHTPGIHIAPVAVGLGASIIEKHFTLDRNLPGPDHRASLNPEELKAMIQAIRDVEMALGDGRKVPFLMEQKNSTVARKSLVASRPIQKGERFSTDNMTIKRPGTGIAPEHFWEMDGKIATRDYGEDDPLMLE